MSLEAKNTTKLYGNQKALDDVSFKINTGEVVGFLGPNGAGKSTMMKIFTGYISQTSGIVKVSGIDTRDKILSIKEQIGYLPESNPLYHDMYVREYLNFSAKVYNIEKKKIPKRVNEIIDITGLKVEQNKKIGALSKGYKQRTGLAAALIHDPKVLILDEPTTGLDPNQIVEIRDLISEIGKEKTVLLSTHIMQEVEAICNRVIIINKGKIVADEPVSAIQKLSSEKGVIINVEFNKTPDLVKLQDINGVLNINQIDEFNYRLETNPQIDPRADIFRFAVDSELILLAMQKKEQSMEDIFRSLTKDNL